MDTVEMPLSEVFGKSKKRKVGKKKKAPIKRRKGHSKEPVKAKVPRLEYELVKAYQTRSIPRSDILVEAPLTPPSYFPDGDVSKSVTLESLRAQGMTPRTFFLNYGGWVAHPKDKAPRAYYQRREGGDPKEKYDLLPKELVKHVLLSDDCYQEVYELHAGYDVFEEMKPFAEHIEKYKTIPYDKMGECFKERHKRTLQDGTVEEVTMYRIEARQVQKFFAKMKKGNPTFSPKPTPGQKAKSPGGSTRKAVTKDGNGTTKRNRNTRKKSVAAKPVNLTKKLKAVMTRLARFGSAFSITMKTQPEFCNDIFERGMFSIEKDDVPDPAVRKSMMMMTKGGYMVTPVVGQYAICTDDVPIFYDSCLTYSMDNTTLYNPFSQEEDKENSKNGKPLPHQEKMMENEDVGFDEESDSNEEECSSSSSETSQEEKKKPRREKRSESDESSSEDSDAYSETASVDHSRLQEELEDLAKTTVELRKQGTLRSGRKRKASSPAPKTLTIESSDDEDAMVVVAPVPEIVQKNLAKRARARTKELDAAEKKKKEPQKRKRKRPAKPKTTEPTKKTVKESPACDETENFTYKMAYTTQFYRMELDSALDANYIKNGAVSEKAALSRRAYIRAFQSMLIETDISKSVIKGLINFDKLSDDLEASLLVGAETGIDFSDEGYVIRASSIIRESIANAIDGDEDEKEAEATAIMGDILYAIYWMISRPVKTGTVLVEDASSTDSDSEEVNPNAVVSPFLAAVKQSKTSKPKKKKKNRTESCYSYYIGNRTSILVDCLDGIFRYIFRNDMQGEEFFYRVQESADNIGAFASNDEAKVRQNILGMFDPGKSPLPVWGKYSGTVVCFMQYLFPITQEGRSFDVEGIFPDAMPVPGSKRSFQV